MKARIVAGLLASLLVLAASSADAGPKKKRGPKRATRPAAAAVTDAGATVRAVAPAHDTTAKHAATSKVVHAGDSAEKHGAISRGTPAGDTTAKDEQRSPVKAPKVSRFLASGVPLVEVAGGRLQGVGSAKLPCGPRARWAKVKSRWHALDAWGRVTGTLTVGGSERDDGTGCHQLRFTEGTGHDGRGVFVAEGSGYSPGPSAQWAAGAEKQRRFDELYAAQERAWTEGKTDPAGAARRTLFFKLPEQEAAEEGSPTQKRPTAWAVSGGRVLVIAYVGASGAWKVGHVSPPNGKVNAYEPLAVLDMNGDGLPEIVVHEEAAGVFTDRVLSFDPASMRWEKAVDGPGGATR
jgi:hypothetical protein